MGCVITPQYQVWAKRFPTLAPYITELQFGACFDQAQLFQANDGSGPIDDPVEALRLMGLMIAHIAVLTYPTTGNPANPDPPSPLATKYRASVGSGCRTASMAARPGLAMGPGGKPALA